MDTRERQLDVTATIGQLREMGIPEHYYNHVPIDDAQAMTEVLGVLATRYDGLPSDPRVYYEEGQDNTL